MAWPVLVSFHVVGRTPAVDELDGVALQELPADFGLMRRKRRSSDTW